MTLNGKVATLEDLEINEPADTVEAMLTTCELGRPVTPRA
jgi:hypothetical protein